MWAIQTRTPLRCESSGRELIAIIRCLPPYDTVLIAIRGSSGRAILNHTRYCGAKGVHETNRWHERLSCAAPVWSCADGVCWAESSGLNLTILALQLP